MTSPDDFRKAATETFQQLAEFPFMGTHLKVNKPELRGVKMWRMHEFESYLILYVPRKDGIAVERVIHASRDYRRLIN